MLRSTSRPLSRRLRLLHNATQQRKDQFVRDIQEQQVRDIDPSSLAATLKAHRASNTALKIRKVGGPPVTKVLRETSRHDTATARARVQTASESRDKDGQNRPLSKTAEDTSLHHGEVIGVLPEYQARDTCPEELLERPWRDSQVPMSGDRRQALHKDLEMYAHWVSLSKDEIKLRRHVASRIQTVLQERFPDISIYVYGSLDSAMSTPCSDIDIGIYLLSLAKDEGSRGPSPFRPRAVKAIHKQLDAIAQLLAESPEFSGIRVVLSTRRPLAQATLQGPLLQMQIVSSGPEQLDALVQIRNFCTEYSQLRPLYFVVKAALVIRDLSESSRGGLGSYQLIVLIGSFLKLRPRTSKESLATTLVDFFSWVADLNTTRYGISVDPPGIFRKRAEGTVLSLQAKEEMNVDLRLSHRHKISLVDNDKPFALILQDPTDLSHDVARTCFRIMDIRATFRSLANDVSRWLEHEVTAERLTQPDAIVGELLGNLPEKEQKRRQISNSWAAKQGQDTLLSSVLK